MNLALPPTILMKTTCGLQNLRVLKAQSGTHMIYTDAFLFTYVYLCILTSYTCIKSTVEQKSELKAICIF